MFDIGWPEMAVIMLVAIVIIGPKDLPRLARTIGKWTGKARAMARDFQRSLDDMAREAELDEIKKSVEKVGSPNKARQAMTSSIKKAIDADDELGDAFDIEADKTKNAQISKVTGAAKPASKGDTGASSGSNAVPGFTSSKPAETASEPASENKNTA